MPLKLLTSGESHGEAMQSILDGMPAGLKVSEDFINKELKRRQAGIGRGQRMKIEEDKVKIVSGLRHGLTIASPIGLLIENKDKTIEELTGVRSPRPGHADLAGALKYGFADIGNVIERASARETVSRVLAGAICKIFLYEFKIKVISRIISIGGAKSEASIKKKIKEAISKKETLGGVFDVIAQGAPIGLGSYVQQDRRLDGRIAGALMSIPGIKAVEFGLGFGYAERFGSEVHDAIYYSKEKGFYRKTNNAGGLEGGITDGADIVARCCMKPISTLLNPLDSVDIITKKPSKANVQRSDVCAVESAAVVAESVVGFEIANAILEKFGQDSLSDIKIAYNIYLKRTK